jgi:hypothetical protein
MTPLWRRLVAPLLLAETILFVARGHAALAAFYGVFAGMNLPITIGLVDVPRRTAQ